MRLKQCIETQWLACRDLVLTVIFPQVLTASADGMSFPLLALALLSAQALLIGAIPEYTPAAADRLITQIHLGLGKDEDVTVSWSTPVGIPANSCVQYLEWRSDSRHPRDAHQLGWPRGLEAELPRLPLRARDAEQLRSAFEEADTYPLSCGSSKLFVDGGPAKYAQVLTRSSCGAWAVCVCVCGWEEGGKG